MHQITTASINFSQGLTDAWSAVARIVPKLVAFIVIFAIGWFIARLLARVLDTVLRKVGFEKVAEHGGVSRALANSKYDATALVCKVVYYALLLITLQLALGVFGSNPVSTMINGVVAWLPRGIVAVIIVILAAAIARVVRDLVGGALSSLSYGNVIATIASVFVLGLGVIAALGQAGIATAITGPLLTAVLAAIVGVIVVGVGGGMIQPMRERWERMLNSAESDARSAAANRGTPYQAGHSDAMGGQTAPRPSMSGPNPPPAAPGQPGGPGMAPGNPNTPMGG
ncbi:MAG: mechanosensitive ion channel family protein [Actinocrinis sp.]